MSKPKANCIIVKTLPPKRIDVSPEARRRHKAILANQLNFKIGFPHTSVEWWGLVTVFYGDDTDPLWDAIKAHSPKSNFATAQDFQHWFFDRVREWVLKFASSRIMYAPLNHTGEFWNPAFLKRVMQHWKRGRTKKAFGLAILDRQLRENWKIKGWHSMPRAKLFEQVKWLAQFVPKINANMVYKRAYDMEL